MTTEEVVRAFVDSALDREMRERYWLSGDVVDGTVTDAELDRLEGFIGLRFPPSYRAFLKYRHFDEFPELGVSFDPHPVDGWEEILIGGYEMWKPQRILGAGLIPFGDEMLMNVGPVCFDTTRRLADGECPVVYWNQNRIGTEQEVQPLFSSSRRMFEALRYAADHDAGFFHYDEVDAPGWGEAKVRFLRGFLATDPEGAGGPARTYWNRFFGVSGA